MVKFSQVVNSSLEWTAAMLFRPFKLKKWLLLLFAAVISGSLAGGKANFNLPNIPDAGKDKATSISQATQDKGGPAKDISIQEQLKKVKEPQVIAAILFIGGLILLLIILMGWLSSRFIFVFLEGVTKNDASIKIPFKTNKGLGNSLFLFYLIFSITSLALLGGIIISFFISLVRLGVFDKGMTVGLKPLILVATPHISLFLFLLFTAIIISLIVKDFVTIVMFKDKINFIKAWQKTIQILNKGKKAFILYILLLIGLGIAAGIISTFLYFAGIFGLLFPAGIIALVSYLIYLATPASLHVLYFIILFAILIPLALVTFYFLMCVFLPFAVFFRTLSIKFFSQLDENYNLFKFS